MANYDHRAIEQKWRQFWKDNRTFVADKNPSDKPKYYVLDMFPYPSGAGLHVGHPLGYIATDIVARHKRMTGHNVLHPMGFDAFGLPAEQYAIERGVHPAITTDQNCDRYWEQMELLGFTYDPDAVLRTSDPAYYKWTQWIFLKLYNHWYDTNLANARPISELEAAFGANGTAGVHAATSNKEAFTADQWHSFPPHQKQDVLMQYRLAFVADGYVNWCPALGTVLANDEVKDGKSERGGHPVERRKMPQWMLRITAYADRLLSGLKDVDFPESIKAQQENWIGRSEGANVRYEVIYPQGRPAHAPQHLEIFTTRPDTIFGNTYMVVAPEHDLVPLLTTDETRAEVEKYVAWARNRSERERTADTTKTGVFTGGYVKHPFTGDHVPVWVSDYVLIGYGTGAIMAVPAHDERDYEFARKFALPITEVVAGGNVAEAAYIAKDGVMVNSSFLNGMKASAAIAHIIDEIENRGLGHRQVTYRMRDVIWSRQRYWGEPTPLIIRNGLYEPVAEHELPVLLPEMEDFKPTGMPESPLVKATDWLNIPGGQRETNTMPGAAGSSWYFLRYFDRDNTHAFADPEKVKYWMPVDLYLGGAEHAVGHLLYSRFWTKFLKDLGYVPVEEPYKKLVNQGMIQGVSALVYRHRETNEFWSADLVTDKDAFSTIHADVRSVRNNTLDVEAFKIFKHEENGVFHLNANGEFKTEPLVEKMSKSKYNTVTPDDICHEYGADTLRLFEMFLGPLTDAKPWGTDSISGVSGFLRRFWGLFHDEQGNFAVTDEAPTAEELKHLHTAIKKVSEDIDKLSLNTCVPAYMVCARELQRLGCRKRAILEPFVKILAPFAPHICEELWAMLGHQPSVLDAVFPTHDEACLVEDSIVYPVQVSGKVRANITVPTGLDAAGVEALALADETIQKWLDGKAPKKVIVVPGRIVNIVV